MAEDVFDSDEISQEFLKAYDVYASAIFRHIFYRVGDRELAKDLAQETFCRAWQQLAKGAKVENLRAFLYRVATNLIIDEVRKKKPVSLDALLEEGFEPAASDAKLAERIDGGSLLKVLAILPERDQAVVVLRYIDDLEPKEMADILGENVNAVSVRLHRAVEKIKDFLNRKS